MIRSNPSLAGHPAEACRTIAEAKGADEWREYALHCERVLNDLRAVATELSDHWASNRDVEVGRLLFALDGDLPDYDKRCDAFRAVFAARPTARSAAEPRP